MFWEIFKSALVYKGAIQIQKKFSYCVHHLILIDVAFGKIFVTQLHVEGKKKTVWESSFLCSAPYDKVCWIVIIILVTTIIEVSLLLLLLLLLRIIGYYLRINA